MLRIVAGIDFEHYPFALAMLQSLRFASAKVHLAHVTESVLPDRTFPELKPTHPISIMLAENERQGEEELKKAAMQLEGSGYALHSRLQRGDPARSLIELGNSVSADLIAVGSAKKGAWASLFFGSVTKALTASAEQSILIAKSHPPVREDLKAVLAVDHSAYCDSSIERFLGWHARGVRHMTVVTAPQHVKLTRDQAAGEMGELHADIEADLSERNERICVRLRAEGIECGHRLVAGHPNQAIEAAMRETDSDLLIMGARGHGFWDRFRLGSVSHYQVVATPHDVLVIRV